MIWLSFFEGKFVIDIILVIQTCEDIQKKVFLLMSVIFCQVIENVEFISLKHVILFFY